MAGKWSRSLLSVQKVQLRFVHQQSRLDQVYIIFDIRGSGKSPDDYVSQGIVTHVNICSCALHKSPAVHDCGQCAEPCHVGVICSFVSVTNSLFLATILQTELCLNWSAVTLAVARYLCWLSQTTCSARFESYIALM